MIGLVAYCSRCNQERQVVQFEVHPAVQAAEGGPAVFYRFKRHSVSGKLWNFKVRTFGTEDALSYTPPKSETPIAWCESGGLEVHPTQVRMLVVEERA